MNSIKQILFGTAVVAVMGLMGSPAMAQSSATEGAAATVTIVKPIILVNNADLAFGSVVTTGATGTVEMPTTGVRVLSASLSDFGSQGNPESAASFLVSGENDATYAITLPASTTLTGPGAAMTVDTFTSNPTVLAGQLDAITGQETLLVGATLHVNALQVAGDYAGTFDVTVAYN